MIELANLHVKYDNMSGPVLNNLNLIINNEKTVIVGPNGSGKTTLLKVIMGLIPISKGSRKVFEKDPGTSAKMTGITI